jgi:Domain of Unknown Function (DUF1080)
MRSVLKSVGLCLSMAVFTVACVLGAHCAAADDGWIPLFNGKNFGGWHTYVESTGKNNDPTHVFKVEDGAIHILDVAPGAKFENGYLPTEQEFSNVRILAEYKWGTKRETEGKRNSELRSRHQAPRLAKSCSHDSAKKRTYPAAGRGCGNLVSQRQGQAARAKGVENHAALERAECAASQYKELTQRDGKNG